MTFNPDEPRGPDGRWIRLAGLLKSAGGFTHNLLTGSDESHGYAVALPGHEGVLPGHASSSDIAAYAKKHLKELSNKQARLGGWYNGEDGKTYLDVSHVHGGFNEALKKARDNKQIALYDLDTGNEYHTLDEDWQPNIDRMKGHDLEGLPQHAMNVPGHGRYTFHSNKELQGIAARYNRDHGLGKHPRDYSTVDPEKAAKVAQAYEDMEHNPDDPEVKAAYDALKKEVLQQYEYLTKAGYSYHFYPEGGDPYANTPREATYDLTQNHKMYVFPTIGPDGGFGEDAKKFPGHPLLEKVPGLQWDGKDVTYNDVFRGVHDSVTHAKEGLGFGPRGEDNTFRQHNSMFSALARKAIASETRGQNTWVNYGPYGEHNRKDPRNTIYAPQKAGILPEWARDPDFLKKDKEKNMSTIYTPTVHEGGFDLSSRDGKLAFWKQILPMKSIHYTAKDGSRRKIDFTKEYLTDLANNKAVDRLGFLLASPDNAHTMDPERWRGEVETLEVRDDGLYGKIVFPNADAAKAVLDNPNLGVSARIREGVARSDGSTLNRGLIHVLGTLDPQVSGMGPWQATDLSTDEGDVLDLSDKEYETMAEKKTEAEKKALADFTEEDIEKMSDEELDTFLETYAAELDEYDESDDDPENISRGENETKTKDDEKVLVGAGADMSKRTGDEANEIELANQSAASANARATEALRRLAEAEWKSARDGYMAEGVPPHALDLAAEVLNRPDDMVIDLSNSGDADVNVSEVVRGLLDALKGTVDLSNEEGHMSVRTASDEDPDSDVLALWGDLS